MRFLLLASLLLCACATTAPAPQPMAPPALSNTPQPSPAWRILQAVGHDSGPTQADVVRAFGEPAISRQDGASLALTYRLETCALLMLFEPDEQNVQRLTIVHGSARRAGGQAPSLEQCAAEAAPQ